MAKGANGKKYVYNYKTVVTLFDIDCPGDKELYEWIVNKRAKRYGFGVIVREALRALRDKESKNIKKCPDCGRNEP